MYFQLTLYKESRVGQDISTAASRPQRGTVTMCLLQVIVKQYLIYPLVKLCMQDHVTGKSPLFYVIINLCLLYVIGKFCLLQLTASVVPILRHCEVLSTLCQCEVMSTVCCCIVVSTFSDLWQCEIGVYFILSSCYVYFMLL